MILNPTHQKMVRLKNNGDNRESEQALLAILMVLLIGAFWGILRTSFTNQYKYATLQMMIDGKAVTPIQFRILGAWIVQAIQSIAGYELNQAVRLYETIVCILCIAMIYKLCRTTGLSETVSFITGVALLYLYPFYFLILPWSRYYYPSDTLAIFFTTLGMWLLYRRYFLAFAASLMIGIFCRESIILLLIPYIFFDSKQISTPKRIAFLLIFLTIFSLDRWILNFLFSSNWGAGNFSLDHDIMKKGLPHSLETSRFYVNIQYLMTVQGIILFLSYGGFLWIPILAGLRLIKDRFVKSSLLVLPLSLLILLFVGNYNEPRIFSDVSPIVLLGSAHALKELNNNEINRQEAHNNNLNRP